jgi:hypothetical protein
LGKLVPLWRGLGEEFSACVGGFLFFEWNWKFLFIYASRFPAEYLEELVEEE